MPDRTINLRIIWQEDQAKVEIVPWFNEEAPPTQEGSVFGLIPGQSPNPESVNSASRSPRSAR